MLIFFLFPRDWVNPFSVPVPKTVPKNSAAVLLEAGWNPAIFPAPAGPKPIAGFVFVQLNVSPPPIFATKLMAAIGAPEQTLTTGMAATTGSGLFVIVNVLTLAPVLVQPFIVAVTVMVPTRADPVAVTGAE